MVTKNKVPKSPDVPEGKYGYLFSAENVGCTLRDSSRDPEVLVAQGPFFLRNLYEAAHKHLNMLYDEREKEQFNQMAGPIKARQVSILLHRIDIERGIDGICKAKLEDVRERYAFMKYELRDKMK